MKTLGNELLGTTDALPLPRIKPATARAGVLLCLLTLLLAWAILSPATAGALPDNLLTNGGTQVSNFETTSDWALGANSTTSYSIALNPVQYREGANSVRLTATAGSSAGGLSFTKVINAAMSGSGAIRFWVYLHTAPSTAATVGVRFSPDATGFTNYFVYNASGLKSGWNLISAAKTDFFVGGGSPSWSQTMLKVRIALTAAANTTAAVSFDDLRYAVVSQPVVLLSFKNGTLGQYSNAFPVLTSYGLNGTAFVDSSDVGKSGQMSLAQLQEIYAAGWDVGNHSNSSKQLTDPTVDPAAALAACTNFLEANGLTRAARQVAYVDGQYNNAVLKAMHDEGMKSGTYIAGLTSNQFQALPMDNQYLIPSWDAGLLISGTQWQGGTVPAGGLNAVKAKISAAIAKGAPLELVFHDVSATGTSSSGYTVSAGDLATICVYIQQLGVPVVTISQLYALNVDPIGPRQNDLWAPATKASTVLGSGGQLQVTLKATDSLSGVKGTYYKLDGSPLYQQYTVPFTLDSSVSHTLAYYSVDNAGNAEATTTMTDFTAPLVTINASGGQWVNGTGGLLISAVDAGSGIREVDYSRDGGATWTTKPGSPASVLIPTEGAATVRYHAVDNAGNMTGDATLPVLVDNTPPASTLSGINGLPSNQPVPLTLSSVDAALGSYAHGSDVASISYSIDRGTEVRTPGDGPLQFDVPQGNHTVTYWSTDTAGNVEAARTVYVRVAAPLPPNLISDQGTQISSLDNASDWTRVGTSGTVAANTAQVREGTGSLRLTTGNPATDGTVVAQESLGSGIDMSSMLTGGAIRFWVYVHTDMTLASPNNILSTFRLRLSPDADGSFTNQFRWGTNRTAIHTGWNLISLSKDDFTSRYGQDPVGNPSWSQPMRWARIEVTANSAQTQTASVSFDDLRRGVRATPAVIMSFDDGDATVYSDAFPIMRARGMVGTSYVVTSQVSNTSFPETMTLAELQDLYAAGWDIANHTLDHANLTTLSLAAAGQELSGAAAYLTNNGMPRAARHVAYPGGTVNATVLQAMADTGMLTGRVVSWRPMALPVDDPYLIPGSSTAPSALSLQQIEDRIDHAVGAGATIQLFFHAFGDPTSDPTYVQSVEEFTAICDYIAQRGIPTMTISQFYAHSQYGASADTTAPVTTADYDGSLRTAPLTVHFTATDSGSGVDYTQYSVDGKSWTNGSSATISDPAVTSLSFRSADRAGNLEQTRSMAVRIEAPIDSTAPTTTVNYTSTAWQRSNVTLSFAASDTGGSGVSYTQSSVDGGATWATGTSRIISTDGLWTVLYRSVDVAGNVETPAKSVVVKLDKTAPTITITAPISGGTYVRNQVVLANWSATDLISGIASATGTGASGAAITTSTFGSKSFSVTATDVAGNSRTTSANYSVPFASTGVAGVNADGSSIFPAGTTVPLSFVLTNSRGRAYSSAQPRLFVSLRNADGAWGTERAAVANPAVTGGNLFTYAGSGRYTFNMGTSASLMTLGTWRLRIDLGGGGALYAQLTLN